MKKYIWYALNEDDHPYIFADTAAELERKMHLPKGTVRASYCKYKKGILKTQKFGRFLDDEDEE